MPPPLHQTFNDVIVGEWRKKRFPTVHFPIGEGEKVKNRSRFYSRKEPRGGATGFSFVPSLHSETGRSASAEEGRQCSRPSSPRPAHLDNRNESSERLTPRSQKGKNGLDAKTRCQFWSRYDSQELCRRHFTRHSTTLSPVNGAKSGFPTVHFPIGEGEKVKNRSRFYSREEPRSGATGFSLGPSLHSETGRSASAEEGRQCSRPSSPRPRAFGQSK